MRYIRTKDGRLIDTTKGEYIINGNHLILYRQYETVSGVKAKPGQMCVPSVAIMEEHVEYNFIGFIEKMADTIEVLCDLFTYIQEDGKHWISPFRTFKDTKEECDYKELFGAIWTDKGLIYVAKLNEKGEIELL